MGKGGWQVAELAKAADGHTGNQTAFGVSQLALLHACCLIALSRGQPSCCADRAPAMVAAGLMLPPCPALCCCLQRRRVSV